MNQTIELLSPAGDSDAFKAAILAGAMMLEHLGEKKAAAAIEKSVAFCTEKKLKSLSAGKMGYTTSGVGDLVIKNL